MKKINQETATEVATEQLSNKPKSLRSTMLNYNGAYDFNYDKHGVPVLDGDEYRRLTVNDILISQTEYFIEHKLDEFEPNDFRRIETELVFITNKLIVERNTYLKAKDEMIPAYKTLTTLVPYQIARLIVEREYIYKLDIGGESIEPDKQELGVYMEEGPSMGCYIISNDAIHDLIYQYNPTINAPQLKEALFQLRRMTNSKEITIDPDLVTVNNGIFNYKTKELQPFDPDMVFMSKSKVNYNPNARNRTYYNEKQDYSWDVESWFAELSDDPEVIESLWEIMSAIVRPNVDWKKCAYLYNEDGDGNNGKGTLLTLMRNLCGPGSHTSVPLASFDEKFALEGIIGASAILVDENPVGTYIDKADKIKAVVTNDVIEVTRKFKSSVYYRFRGFMVQCLNDFPKIKDKTDSFHRRQLFLPLDKKFEGRAKSDIKNVYLHEQDVLEYVLYKVLNTDFYELSTPKISKDILNAFKESNDPVRQFMTEIIPELKWDLVPYQFLYDLYKAWFRRNMPSGGKEVGKNKFIAEVKVIINGTNLSPANEYFKITGDSAVKSLGKMNDKEPLVHEYDLKDWINKDAGDYKTAYRGIVRRTDAPALTLGDVTFNEEQLNAINNNTQ